MYRCGGSWTPPGQTDTEEVKGVEGGGGESAGCYGGNMSSIAEEQCYKKHVTCVLQLYIFI